MASKALWLGLCLLPGLIAAETAAQCWSEPTDAVRIDIDGTGGIVGALALPETLVSQRLAQSRVPMELLLNGYDVLKAERVCQQVSATKGSAAGVLFGGRERYLAQQGEPAWNWLMVSADAVAANLVMGVLPGVFVGEGKAVVGKGLEQSAITDPAKMAAWLMDTYQGKRQPVVLFISAEHQQPFFEFFSSSPLPGVFLSFESPETVRDALNKHAKFSADDQARLLNYYCK
ncbi:hypothetical protein LRS11_16020 [Pseudomonas sp. J452]|uniref:hypothetical protein n=1 Tax=Pseudomonas sp. J452 TaxID=2898441 RepID=UPI0021AD7336|nr:hypothetical protein [Pseudomonas sp. J452]UUY07320.1 hypothetical protein LRS11_16020 [Pseudomonas sp. J452]